MPRHQERGDTLIEVLVAIATLAVVVVGAFSLMSRGVSQMYDSMERSQVRMLLNSQIDALTYARDEYTRSLQPSLTGISTESDAAAQEVWDDVQTNVTSLTTAPSLDGCSDADAANAFWIDTSGLLLLKKTGFKALSDGFPAPGSGIWIQKIDHSGGSIPYKDFYVRACWTPTGSSVTQVISTVVRLYDQ